MAKLDLITIASPCQASWEAMRGDDRVRHCAQCHLDVYDLSAMPRADAERFVAENEGHACVKFFQRPDGTVVTEDCATLREEPPRPCAPRPPDPTHVSNERSMAASKPTNRGAMRMGKMAAPPPEAEPDPIDERLGRGTVLAELVRAVRASFEVETAERYVRALEPLVAEPEGAKPARCPRGAECPLWIVPAKPALESETESLDTRTKLVEALTSCVQTAFDAPRAATLLRELRRHPFRGTSGPCPHCRMRIRAVGSDDWD